MFIYKIKKSYINLILNKMMIYNQILIKEIRKQNFINNIINNIKIKKKILLFQIKIIFKMII